MRRFEWLAVLHLSGLVVFRLVRDADDFANWDLIPLLNAYTAPSLRALLFDSVVHLANPWTFPVYNTGGESVFSALALRALVAVDGYWASVLVLLAYDVAFFWLLGRFFRLATPLPAAAWLLAAFSPLLLTFAATSAFNMQGYLVLIMGLYAVERFARGEGRAGTAWLALAFALISQGYPIGFFLPYFAGVYATFRWLAAGERRALASLKWIAGMALAVHAASGGAYLRKISPLDPHESGAVLEAPLEIARRAALFARLGLWPAPGDGPSAGFGPAILVAIALAAAAGLAWAALTRPREARAGAGRALTAGAAACGLVGFGYLPAFLSPWVKSQRAVFGDIFLALVVSLAVARLVAWGRLPARLAFGLLVPLALASDAAYLTRITMVDHRRSHRPAFDFDPADGVARHDLDAAIREMKRQSEETPTTLLIVYPRGRSENTTDPAMFHARFLRHFGPYAGRADVVFPFRSCDPRYGCAFPEVAAKSCAERGCFESPLGALREARLRGDRVRLWWWKQTPKEARYLSFESLELKLLRPKLRQVQVPAAAAGWECYEVG
ncbi:MAG: hypothetical protein AB7O37_08005 [Vicinamibacteria bacterium]